MPFFAFYHKINPIFTIFVRFLLDLLPKNSAAYLFSPTIGGPLR